MVICFFKLREIFINEINVSLISVSFFSFVGTSFSGRRFSTAFRRCVYFEFPFFFIFFNETLINVSFSLLQVPISGRPFSTAFRRYILRNCRFCFSLIFFNETFINVSFFLFCRSRYPQTAIFNGISKVYTSKLPFFFFSFIASLTKHLLTFRLFSFVGIGSLNDF